MRPALINWHQAFHLSCFGKIASKFNANLLTVEVLEELFLLNASVKKNYYTKWFRDEYLKKYFKNMAFLILYRLV